ncbi:uncharacterized protein QC763_506407 [Podospora pseudopauciseta]|uniref:Infection structure specific protein n=1 Tax=Podospora pseudopauciseta TaxID=2093780 RepID=A0ABR0H9R6_9PEZI|nr:hypothetical protein QC763_506407 [Podospora pseudopauciseta]
MIHLDDLAKSNGSKPTNTPECCNFPCKCPLKKNLQKQLPPPSRITASTFPFHQQAAIVHFTPLLPTSALCLSRSKIPWPNAERKHHKMFTYTLVSALIGGASLALASPAPVITPAPIYERQSESALELKCQAHYESMMARAPDLPREHPIIQWMNQPENLKLFTDYTDIKAMCAARWGKSTLEPPSSLASQWSSYMSEAQMFAISMKAPAHELSAMGCPSVIAAAGGLLAITEEVSCSRAYKAYMDAVPYLTATDGDDFATTGPTQTNVLAPSTTAPGSSEETDVSGNDSEDEGADGNGNGGSEEGSTETTSTSTAGGPRETGHVAVAAAAALAVVGAMAAL